MTVDSYLNKLLVNDALREAIIKHFGTISKILSHPDCDIIKQLSFNLDLIEVADGYVFQISKRTFTHCPLTADDYRRVSPRAFVPYDCASTPDPRYFKEGIMNSFPELRIRVRFLNKLYQCLLAGRMPQKVPKLVVSGPRDSGKTSWASIFLRIIPKDHLASITSEKQFSAAMVKENTQLILIDDWSESTMSSQLAKTLLQGGWMVTAVKHRGPRQVINNSPFYITTNKLPDFGDENANVRRRLAIFETSSLPETRIGVDKWIYDHAMECIAWMAEEISENIELVEVHEIWYGDSTQPSVIIDDQTTSDT